ncbi:nucleotidyltransferase family protein [Kosakonia sp. YIM B13611]|uniref:nucleotidyltransferase family protein n=1 Tax=unclassified Kosakonia TaxID=2632876 RepID=UPI0036C0BE6E
MRYAAELEALLRADSPRMAALAMVRATHERCWIGAGFIRDAVWDQLHGFTSRPHTGDVDVIWREPADTRAEHDAELEAQLRLRSAGFAWSVKNQARMHTRNDDAPYASLEEALWHWPETATAVAVRLDKDDRLAIVAPFGLADLFCLRLQPTPRFQHEKRHLFHQRVDEKRWLIRYPKLQLCG